MLRYLRIEHLAVIDRAEVEFGAGLNVLTGETGVGKSVLVEAVGLLLGARASTDLVRTGEESASVEALFERNGDEIVLRREVTAQGRTRAFLNGALATAGALKDHSETLVELHGQREHQVLLDPATHLDVLDEFATLTYEAAVTARAFDAYRTAAEDAARARKAAAEREARRDALSYPLDELERARLEAGEDERLLAVRQVLANAERVERLCAESYAVLYESDQAILTTLGGVWRRVSDLAALDARFGPYLEAREGIKAQLEDLALFLRRYADTIEASPSRLQQVEERLALLERLKRKHGPTLADALTKRARLRKELDELEQVDERVRVLTEQESVARAAFLQGAEALGRARRQRSGDFAKALEGLLSELAMEGTRFEVRFNPAPLPETAWTRKGIDAAEFFLSPNPGEELRPLARIASGGELSRIMLAVKTLGAGTRDWRGSTWERAPARRQRGDAASGGDGEMDGADREDPTADRDRQKVGPSRTVPGAESSGAAPSFSPSFVFDEIDSGIGGRAADVVGAKLRALGARAQVLCITHLPQIAAYADIHFEISKRVEGGRTWTAVRRLDEAARVDEIARMLGGDGSGRGLRAAAREMLTERRRGGGESERAKAKGVGR